MAEGERGTTVTIEFSREALSIVLDALNDNSPWVWRIQEHPPGRAILTQERREEKPEPA